MRDKVDAGSLEVHSGIELPAENTHRLRAPSGNDMGEAVAHHLQGYLNPSESRSADTFSQREEQQSRMEKNPNISGSVSSIESWRQRRQTGRSSQSHGSELAEGLPSQRATLLVDRYSIMEASEQGCAQRNRQKK